MSRALRRPEIDVSGMAGSTRAGLCRPIEDSEALVIRELIVGDVGRAFIHASSKIGAKISARGQAALRWALH